MVRESYTGTLFIMDYVALSFGHMLSVVASIGRSSVVQTFLGFSLGTQVSSHSPKSCRFKSIGDR